MARYRGTMVQQVLRLPIFASGMPARERLLARLSPAGQAWMRATLLTTDWYDESIAVEMSNAVVAALGLETDDAIIQWFRRQHMQGYVGMLRQAGIRTPAGLWAALPALWTRQHDTGTLTITQPTKLSAVISIRGNTAALDRVHGLALRGGTEGLVTLAGAVGVRSATRSTRNEASFSFEWDAEVGAAEG